MSQFAVARLDEPLPPGVFEPDVDIHDRAEDLLMRVDLPGSVAENLSVRVEGGVLSIQAQVQIPLPPRARVVFQQFRFGDFQRSFILTPEIDVDRISATFDRGVLTVVLPRRKT